MQKMTETAMRTTDGGAIYTYYKCNICGTVYGAKLVMKLHCKNKHGISTCFKTVYYPYKLF